MFKKLIVPAAAAMLLTAACKVEKTGNDTYSVQTPTPEARAAAEKATAETQEAGRKINASAQKAADELKPQLQEAGKELKAGARTAAEKTGEVMQKAGKSLEEHTEKAKQTDKQR